MASPPPPALEGYTPLGRSKTDPRGHDGRKRLTLKLQCSCLSTRLRDVPRLAATAAPGVREGSKAWRSTSREGIRPQRPARDERGKRTEELKEPRR